MGEQGRRQRSSVVSPSLPALATHNDGLLSVRVSWSLPPSMLLLVMVFATAIENYVNTVSRIQGTCNTMVKDAYDVTHEQTFYNG